LPTSCILLTAAAIVGIIERREIKLPTISPTINEPTNVAKLVARMKYQYWALVEIPEKSA
jgi:uncharacterized membrane protein